MPVYLDCSATTPIDLEIEKEFLLYIREEYGTRAATPTNSGTGQSKRWSRHGTACSTDTLLISRRFDACDCHQQSDRREHGHHGRAAIANKR